LANARPRQEAEATSCAYQTAHYFAIASSCCANPSGREEDQGGRDGRRVRGGRLDIVNWQAKAIASMHELVCGKAACQEPNAGMPITMRF